MNVILMKSETMLLLPSFPILQSNLKTEYIQIKRKSIHIVLDISVWRMKKDNWESIFSSFEEKDFLYLSHKEIKRINVNIIDLINPKTTKFQKAKSNHQVAQKSILNIMDKSSREMLKDMLI